MKIIYNNIMKCCPVHTVENIHKNTWFLLMIILCLCLTGCNNKNKQLNKSTTVSNSTTTEVFNNTKIKESATSIEYNDTLDIEYVDYNDCFNGIEGCAVFFNSSTNEYKLYNKELCEKRTSPCSTFKIISTLMGLEKGVIKSVDSTMGYDGTIYPIDAWNEDLSLKNAFKESCIWYFRKVIDQIGQGDVQKYLNQLKYGNCDINEWYGNGINSVPELNGFWLESSLKISPKEQVNVLHDIFNGKTDFSKLNIKILKEIMLTQQIGNVYVYGKTGTGKNAITGSSDNGWFVGMLENCDERYYFAVRLTDEKSNKVSGLMAKEIALNIINQYYVEK